MAVAVGPVESGLGATVGRRMLGHPVEEAGVSSRSTAAGTPAGSEVLTQSVEGGFVREHHTSPGAGH